MLNSDFGKWTLCDFFATLSTFELAMLSISEEAGTELEAHAQNCNDMRCISERTRLDQYVVEKARPAKEQNAILNRFGKECLWRYKEYQKELLEKYAKFKNALDFCQRNPQYQTMCQCMAGATLEELVLLLDIPRISLAILEHASFCQTCGPAYDKVENVHWGADTVQEETKPSNEEDIRQQQIDELPTDKKICLMLAGMSDEDVMVLLSGRIFPEDPQKAREHANNCPQCQRIILQAELAFSSEEKMKQKH